MHRINVNRMMLLNRLHNQPNNLNANLTQENPTTKWKTETEKLLKEYDIDEGAHEPSLPFGSYLDHV